MLELDKSGFDQTDIDIISVDIFDTVLLRDYSCGQRHFLGIARQSAKQLKVAGYAVDAEDILRARNEVQALAYCAVEIERPEGDVRLEQNPSSPIPPPRIAIVHGRPVARGRARLRGLLT